MSWAWKPECAPGCMNSKYKCLNFWCEKLLKKENSYCMKCRKLQKQQQNTAR